MKLCKKLIRKLRRLIYGKRMGYFPTIYELENKYTKGIEKWEIKLITRKEMYKNLGSAWFLVNSRYPNPKILKEMEIGANVLSKTRYILKK